MSFSENTFVPYIADAHDLEEAKLEMDCVLKGVKVRVVQCSSNKRVQKAAERDIELVNFTPDSKIAEIKKFTVHEQI